MTDLLDGNALVALAVLDHVHHEVVEAWFAAGDESFATCPITQGTLIRLLLRGGASAEQAVRVLRGITEHDRHEFWADAVSFHEVDVSGVVGHRQVTDAYLAYLALHRGGRLVTLDRGLAALRPSVAVLIEPDLG